MTTPAIALAEAAEALRETARTHKRASQTHRKAARDAMRRAAFLERLVALGLNDGTQEDHHSV